MGLPKGFVEGLERIVGHDNVITDEVELLVYEADGSLAMTARPDVVVFPGSTEEASKVLRLAWDYRVPIVGRGSGTSLSGGAQAVNGGVIVSLSRMRRILDIDIDNEVVTVEAGVVNGWIDEALRKYGYQYAIDLGYFYPADPGSQRTATIGGNIGHNAGGVKCFKYGVTVNQVRGLEVVLPNGEVRFFGGKTVENPGYDLVGITVGSEGTFGIVTKAILRIAPSYEASRTILAAFDSLEKVGNAVFRIIGSGIRPVALELMDNLAIKAVESGPFAGGLPQDAEAILLVQVEGSPPGAETEAGKVVEILKEAGAYMVKQASSPAEANRWWNARKNAFGAMGYVGPNYLTEDITIPRRRLAEALTTIRNMGMRYGLRVAFVFHAGDGNLHPLILYDERKTDEKRRALEMGDEIFKVCVEMGGTITGEHGVGYYKKKFMPLIYNELELNVMKNVKSVFDPLGIMNPGKIFP